MVAVLVFQRVTPWIDPDIINVLLNCIKINFQFQYGKTAKFYVYSPGEIDLNTLINRCKEMPRKRGPGTQS